jgi:hypothetical protein
MKLSVGLAKLGRLGKIEGKSPADTPNHARVSRHTDRVKWSGSSALHLSRRRVRSKPASGMYRKSLHPPRLRPRSDDGFPRRGRCQPCCPSGITGDYIVHRPWNCGIRGAGHRCRAKRVSDFPVQLPLRRRRETRGKRRCGRRSTPGDLCGELQSISSAHIGMVGGYNNSIAAGACRITLNNPAACQ